MARGHATSGFLRASSLVLLGALLVACVAHGPVEKGQSGETYRVEPGTDAVARAVESMRAAGTQDENESLEEGEKSKPVKKRREKTPELDIELDPVGATEFELDDDDQDVVGVVQLIRARADDTFSDIARTYGLGYDELVNANPGVDPWIPPEGTPIVLPTQFVLPPVPREGIVLNIAAKRLYYFPEPEEGEAARVITHPIGIGRVGWATPIGVSKVIAKAKDPAWYVPKSVRKEHREAGDPLPAVVPPGEDNPLGHRVLKLGLEGYLIHGTNQPYGVGMRVSHGCVRLYPENIETLYEAADLGTKVTIVNEPIVGGWHDGSYFIQAYPALEDDERDIDDLLQEILKRATAEVKYSDSNELESNAAVIVENARGYPVLMMNSGPETTLAANPRAVRNIVVVDNPVSESELSELLDVNDEPQT